MLPGKLRWFMSEQVHIAGGNNPIVKSALELGLCPEDLVLYKFKYYYYYYYYYYLSRFDNIITKYHKY